jgi:hypothetical protein
MTSDDARRLARISAVADDLDKILDDLFASVSDLKALLLANQPDSPDSGKGGQPDA